MRILLVEDEKEMARLVSSLISHCGFSVDVAPSIGGALGVISQIHMTCLYWTGGYPMATARRF